MRALEGRPNIRCRRCAFFFRRPGGLRPQAFYVAAVAVYLAGAASQCAYHAGRHCAHVGLWLFAAAQALLIWVWFVLHAKRLHDAGRAVGLAAGASLLYALSVVLLLILAASFLPLRWPAQRRTRTRQARLGLILLISIVAILGSAPSITIRPG